MSAEDLQIIIQAVYPETTVEFDVVPAFITADPYDKPEGWDIFWGQLGLAWQKAYKCTHYVVLQTKSRGRFLLIFGLST